MLFIFGLFGAAIVILQFGGLEGGYQWHDQGEICIIIYLFIYYNQIPCLFVVMHVIMFL